MKLDLSEKLWQTSYAVTGFAILQAIAYLYSLEKPGICKPVHEGLIWSLPLIVAFHAMYIGAIQWCFVRIKSLAGPVGISIEEKTILDRIKQGQQITVVLFGVLALAITVLICCQAKAS